ncbi:MAG: hypothetical protein LBB85_11735 [Dysgonamonadaceae bacterium]|jgi:hypothetical protein|nr:hypothetical protein [Dysgonamonadaceae bacterium]
MLTNRKKIENSTRFKATYMIIGEQSTSYREFASYKAMMQWVERNDRVFDFFLINKYALINEAWEPFATIGKKNITLSDLKMIVKDLELCDKDFKPSKNKKVKNKNHQ